MKLVNEAGVPAERLSVIRDFIKARSIHHRHVVVLLLKEDPEAPGAAFMTGDAIPGGGWAAGYNERHMVKVYVPTLNRPYPTTQQNPAVSTEAGSCPVVTLDSWEEELVLVLAHEFAHIAQFFEFGAERTVRDTNKTFEVWAEQVARSTLARWRNREEMRRQMAARRAARG